jgi:hypothetical protein
MEMHNLIDLLLGVLLAGVGWFLSNQVREVKRIDILLNRTREDFASKNDLTYAVDKLSEALHRMEDKLDKALTKG